MSRPDAPLASLFGLAPGGVCRAADVATRAVRSYRTISPLPAPLARHLGGIFLLHFPWAHAPQALPGTVPSGARTFLHVPAHTATAWPTLGAHHTQVPPFMRAAARRCRERLERAAHACRLRCRARRRFAPPDCAACLSGSSASSIAEHAGRAQRRPSSRAARRRRALRRSRTTISPRREVRVRARARREFAERAAVDGLVQLGELARDGARPRRRRTRRGSPPASRAMRCGDS